MEHKKESKDICSPGLFQSHRFFFIIPLKVAKVHYDIEHTESTKIASNHDGAKPKSLYTMKSEKKVSN